MASEITQADVAAIESYFSAGHHFERSTFGAMLTRQGTIAFGANGRRHKLTKRTWWWRPGDYARGALGGLYERDDAPAPPMALGKSEGGEPSYTPEDRVLEAFGAASRRMLAVERKRDARGEPVGLRAKRTLEAYYGDRGRRWEWYATDRQDSRGKAVKGAGPGKIAAVFILTARGRDFIARERGRAEKRVPGSEAVTHLSDDEVLSATFSVLKAQPDIGKTALLNRIQDEAEVLVLEAQRVWRATAPGGEQPPRGDRRGHARAWYAPTSATTPGEVLP